MLATFCRAGAALFGRCLRAAVALGGLFGRVGRHAQQIGDQIGLILGHLEGHFRTRLLVARIFVKIAGRVGDIGGQRMDVPDRVGVAFRELQNAIAIFIVFDGGEFASDDAIQVRAGAATFNDAFARIVLNHVAGLAFVEFLFTCRGIAVLGERRRCEGEQGQSGWEADLHAAFLSGFAAHGSA